MAKKEIALDANGKRKFGIRDKLAYAAGDAGCNLSFGLKGSNFLACFYDNGNRSILNFTSSSSSMGCNQ